MCSGIIQHHKGHIHVLDELVLPDTKTDSAVDAFLERTDQHHWNPRKLHLYGDATGNARDSTSGTSDWIIIKNRLRPFDITPKVPRSNPPIKETLNALSAKLKSADGTVSLTIHPRCQQLIQDFRNALWPSPDQLHNEHSLAWLRYFVHREYPLRLTRPPSNSTIGFAG